MVHAPLCEPKMFLETAACKVYKVYKETPRILIHLFDA